jgi:hypothetical protein
VRQFFLDVTNGVVAEVTCQTAAESGLSGTRRHLEARHVILDELQRIARFDLFDWAVVVFHCDMPAAHHDADFGRQADEGVASEALAAFDRLQQVGVGLVGELEIEGQRRVEVSQRFQRQRDAVVALLGKLIEFLFGHDICSTKLD